MRKSLPVIAGTILLAVTFLSPVMAQQKYTNADLEKYRLEGAYTNEDLAGLKSLPDWNAPLFSLPEVDLSPWQAEIRKGDARHGALLEVLWALQAELDYENDRLEIAYSARGGRANSFLYPGRLSKVAPRLEYLKRRISLVERELDGFAR